MSKIVLPVKLSVPSVIGLTLAACSGQYGVTNTNFVLILADDMGYSDIGCSGLWTDYLQYIYSI